MPSAWSPETRGTTGSAALVVVDAFAALTAVGGGIVLATGSKVSERFPASWLRDTPFVSYVLPGLILAGAVGGSAAVATVATLRRPRIGGATSVVAGVIMVGWIVGEVLLLPGEARSWSEVLYLATGLLMSLVGLRVGRARERQGSPGDAR